MTRRNHITAFTLLELLIALTLSGLLIVMINQQIQNSFFVDSRYKNQLEYRLKIETIFDFLSADISQSSYFPDGKKSVKTIQGVENMKIIIKRFGLSPINKQISGMTVIWTLGSDGISRTIRSDSMSQTRYFSTKKVFSGYKNIDGSTLRVIIENDDFSKSKLFLL